jgi:DnaA family protein
MKAPCSGRHPRWKPIADVLFSPQIPLPLEPRRDSRFEDFVPGPNGAVLEAVRQVLHEPGATLFLSGPESSGKTHLLNALCHAARDSGRTAFYAGLRGMPAAAQGTLEGLEGLDLVCVDDLHEVAGERAWETALFHLFNRIRGTGAVLVVASRDRLSAMPLELPDLASRLGWGPRLQLQALDDTDKLAVICRHAAALGVELPGEVRKYLLERGPRNLADLLLAVERMQQAAFTAKRRLTVPLAREVLKGA